MLGNLPEESTSFVGREWELFRLDRALEKHRLITLVGSGGVGKSRLALRAARRAADRYPQGVAWVELSPLQGDRLLLTTVSEACALFDHTPRMPVDALCEWLAEKRLLLVLDSCEHLVAACRALLGDLLTTVPGLTVLTTSREPLGLDAERLIDVEPLSVHGPDALELFTQRLASARRTGGGAPVADAPGPDLPDPPGPDPAAPGREADVRRADGRGTDPAGSKERADTGGGASGPGRSGAGGSPDTGTDADTGTGAAEGPGGPDTDGSGGADSPGPGTRDAGRIVAASARICQRLEGIPLALELAAAQAARTGVEEVADRLVSRFDVLEAAEDVDVRPERHRTMRTAIGWSHELCAPLERLLWARLTVFRGDFDEASARSVCAGGPLDAALIGPLLERLVSVSVLRSVRAGDAIRFRMLGTIREYGRLWLCALEEETMVARRHAAHHLRLVLRAESEWLGPGQARWYRRISAAHTELCAALDHFLTDSPRHALRLAGLLGFFWSCCGHLHEARDYLERTLTAHTGQGPDRTRALWALGVTITLQGEYGTAQRVSDACTRSAQLDDSAEGALSAAYLSGLIALLTGRPLEAEQTAARALDAAGGRPFDSPSRLRCHLVRVFALTGLGRLPEAREHALRLRHGCVTRGESWTRAYLDYQLSLITLFAGEPREAAEYARAMLACKKGLGDSFGIALGLDVLAAAIAAGGDGRRAGRVYGTGQAFWSTVGHPQRGTPELQAVREACERAARAGVGDAVYERAYREGATTDLDTGLRAALLPPGG
ncbi:NB-ARC domain-containing protein [Streptomyces sp. NPDC004609]|uniref:NB-ARC domain-containing protein n=1 Tax=Streptomyces sp. NPDC004609 TaxID=3364704 RepID=UPI0036B36188